MILQAMKNSRFRIAQQWTVISIFLLIVAAASFLISRPSHASDRSNIDFVGVGTDLNGHSDIYQGLARSGPYGLPDSSIVYSLPEESQVRVMVPPNLDPGATLGLVILSHDTLGEPTSYMPLIRHLVSHGNFVLGAVHEDSVVRGGINRYDVSVRDISTLEKISSVWESRVKDIGHLLNMMPFLEETYNVKFDKNRIAFIGDGFGAYTGMMLAGMRVLKENGDVIYVRSQDIKRYIFIDPPGLGDFGIVNGSFDTLDAEFLAYVSAASPKNALDSFNLSRVSPRYLAFAAHSGSNSFDGSRSLPGSYSNRLFNDILASMNIFVSVHRPDRSSLLNGSFFEQESVDLHRNVGYAPRITWRSVN